MSYKRKEKASRIIITIILLLTISISIAFIYLYNGGYSRIPASLKNAENSQRLNVLYDKQYKIKDRIKYYIDDDKDNIGLIYKDLTTGETIKFNSDKDFLAASTYKVGLNIYGYELAKSNKVSLNDMVPYKESHFEEGAGTLQYKEDLETEELQNLLDLSISHSDNIASNMISDYLGGKEKVREGLNEQFDTNMPIDENIISPNDELKMLEYIYNNSEDESMKHLSDVMKNTIYNSRINRYLPEGITAHKVGTYDTSIHDVGIIYDKNPYILIVYTENLVEDVTVDCTKGEDMIATLSKAIYEYHINK